MEDGLFLITSLRSCCPRCTDPLVTVSHRTKCGVTCTLHHPMSAKHARFPPSGAPLQNLRHSLLRREALVWVH